ncbi:adenosylmethionine-8-amino-7-oxononanoate aminotransferase [Sulfuriferula plumbiphila]|uniref:Diaminobutyrate--2-oxoglutarate transaminase n=1 Tax=Sulfuriferula plumbiphila TaxID=171865 RepID=A0A512L7T5_9PROT|nr:adenosylmethionine-8-amino-7-oxononanoate aminotransferase [Sulfuriferula plumbiphila]GEP30201.1 adenosylmethionine-8-amino-7-oxononanoate aminotransferase [Sulfuriferula plumbiphila]
MAQKLDCLWMPFTDMQAFARDPLVLQKAEGPYVYDIDGNEYLDCISSLWHVGVGHGNRHYLDRIKAQLDGALTSASLFGSAHMAALDLASRLVAFVDDARLRKVFFSSGGSEAVETALKVAIQYNKIRGRGGDKVVYLKRAYHGVTLGALSAMGIEGDRMGFEAHLSREFIAAESPHCYRCPYGLSRPRCELACAKSLERLIAQHPGEITTLIVEPVQGAGGIIVPPPDYLRELHRICREHDIVFILDEVVTGYWRTGARFAFQAEGVAPDILVLSKGMSGGVLPLGATVVSREIFDTFTAADEVFMHGNTYGGNPLSCAAGIAHLEFVSRPEFAARVHALVGEFAAGLEALKHHDLVGDIRQKGLMAGIELVTDRVTKEPYKPQRPLALLARRHGLLLRPLGNVITLFPMMTVTPSALVDMFVRLDAFLHDLGRMSKRGGPRLAAGG